MKALLINDTSKWYHFGCAGTSTALKEEIIKLGYELTALPISETYKISSVHFDYGGFLETKNYEKFVYYNQDLDKLLKEHDIIIINGEGTLHGNRQAPIGLLYVAYIAKKILNKHVEILDLNLFETKKQQIYSELKINLYFLKLLVLALLNTTNYKYKYIQLQSHHELLQLHHQHEQDNEKPMEL